LRAWTFRLLVIQKSNIQRLALLIAINVFDRALSKFNEMYPDDLKIINKKQTFESKEQIIEDMLRE
jgi:hypothetical protein